MKKQENNFGFEALFCDKHEHKIEKQKELKTL